MNQIMDEDGQGQRRGILALESAFYWVFVAIIAGSFGCGVSGSVEPMQGTAEIEIQWVPQESGLAGSLRGVCAVDREIGWISGAAGSFARTRDGGQTWQPGVVPGAEELDFRDVYAWSAKDAYLMAAGPDEKSSIYGTHDGGLSWEVLYQNLEAEGFFNGMAFWDSRSGIVYGDAVEGKLFVISTADGGHSWTRVPPQALPVLLEDEHGFAASGTGVAVASDQIWIATGGSRARVFHSRDRGSSWAVSNTPIRSGDPASGIFSLSVGETGLVVAAGGSYQDPGRVGENLAFSRHGDAWTLIQAEPRLGYKSAIAILPGTEDQVWVATGTSGSHYSLNGGRNWVEVETTGYHALDFGRDGKSGWAVGSGGRVARVLVEGP